MLSRIWTNLDFRRVLAGRKEFLRALTRFSSFLLDAIIISLSIIIILESSKNERERVQKTRISTNLTRTRKKDENGRKLDKNEHKRCKRAQRGENELQQARTSPNRRERAQIKNPQRDLSSAKLEVKPGKMNESECSDHRHDSDTRVDAACLLRSDSCCLKRS